MIMLMRKVAAAIPAIGEANLHNRLLLWELTMNIGAYRYSIL
jgi:hypothetical protein